MTENLDEAINQARIWYIDAAIAEAQAVCNVLESNTYELAEARAEQASKIGEHSQVKFNEFVNLCHEKYGDVMYKLAEALGVTPEDIED